MTVGNDSWLHEVVDWIQELEATELPENLRLAIQSADEEEVHGLVAITHANCDCLATNCKRASGLMQLMSARAAAVVREKQEENLEIAHLDAQTLDSLYENLEVGCPDAAAHVLRMLAIQNSEEAVETLASLLVKAPPSDWQAVGIALSPLWSTSPELLEVFFERVGNDFVHPATMAVLLDLANYSVRNRKLSEHPWSAKCDRLSQLLQSVIDRLTRLEKSPEQFGETVAEVQQTLGDSLALTVSLCDALGTIGNTKSIPVLTETLKLSHRRVQTEACAALVRLGEEQGRNRLIELANDRVSRLRAVAYAEELGFIEKIPEADRLPTALAESQLAAWLAGADQFGFPPTEMELVDSRTIYWPSYEEPQNCFLFRYAYHLPDGSMSNVGIAGPCTHAFHTDIANLPVDDIFACFAGWNVEHDEIFEVPPAQLNVSQRREMDSLAGVLQGQEFESVEPIALTFFLGELAIIAKAEKNGKTLCVLTDGSELLCYPMSASPSSMTPEVVLCLFRGRKLLRTFNA